jgi:hypothetical protein
MPLPGGPADKLGNRYEQWWTVSQLVEMIQGGADAIRIEDPRADNVEFVIYRASQSEMHQAKTGENWTLAKMARGDRNLLQAIGAHLAAADAEFVFVSNSGATELSELAERARQAESLEEFGAHFLAAQEHAKNFEKLKTAWNCDTSVAFDRVRRVHVRTIDEKGIEQQVRSSIQACFLVDPAAVTAELRTLVLDSVHKQITRDGLVEHLAQHGFPLRRVNPRNAADVISEATKRYLDGARSKLIGHKIIPRAATQVLLQKFDGATRDSLLTGKAGAGKTACVVEFIDALQVRGVPVLAFRLDRLEAVQTTRALGDRLGLEESPALVLAEAAKGREAVLVIDQLDAVSTTSGRTSGLFDAVEGLLNEVRGLRVKAPLRVVLVCREFDWKNDPELNKLLQTEQAKVEVGEFFPDETKRLLAETGFSPSVFREPQLKMLRLPQNLSLFLESGFDRREAPVFDTGKELFDRYWDAKRDAVTLRAQGTPDQWNEALGILSEEMTRTQQLYVPREKLDRISSGYLKLMVSEGVLTFDGKRYGFGHESFFDYVFARSFTSQDQHLVPFLTGSEQHLFRRAQVRQVLTYLRDADGSRYREELSALLADQRVRIHLKDLAIGLLASVSEPSYDEWVIFEHLLQPFFAAAVERRTNADRFAELAWRHFWGSPSWFGYAKDQGLIREWLASDKSGLVNVAVGYLLAHVRRVPDAVADLFRPYTQSGGDWPQRVRSVIEWADHSSSRSLFDLTLQLIDRGTLDEARGPIASNSTFWSMFYGLATKRPEWIPEVIDHWLRRRLALKQAKGEDPEGIFGADVFAAEAFKKASDAAPAAYIQHVLPIVLEIADRAARQVPPPRRDSVWPILYKTTHPSAGGACLGGLVAAFATLAKDARVNFRETIERLRQGDTYLSNFLLLNLYTAGGGQFADEAVLLLSDQPWRFECGFADSPRWTARELIRITAPLCSAENRTRLEKVLFDYKPSFEQKKVMGRASYGLLSAIPAELRSQKIKAGYQELERKFDAPPQPPRGMAFGYVRSPIESKAADKMSDEQWLRAIAKYNSDDRQYSYRDPFKGGADELAVMLKGYVEKEPERFARLALRFPAGTNPAYYVHVLDGLKAARIPLQLKLDVTRKVYAEDANQCGTAIADLLGSIEGTLPDDAVEMLAWLGTEHPDPEREMWREDAKIGGKYFGGDILNNGINTTRGRAAEAIRDLILRDGPQLGRFRGTLDRMVRDKSTAVLSCTASTLLAVADHDEEVALELFRVIDFADDRLLATPNVYEFIRRGLRVHCERLRPLIERMLRSEHAAVLEGGACLAAIAAFEHPEAADLRDQAVAGNESVKLGIARVAASNITSPECRDWCEQRLISLFDDESEKVREAATQCFPQLEEQPLRSYVGLISAFCNSKSYAQHSFPLLHLLENSPHRLPGLTCWVCEKFFSRFSNENRNVRTSRAGNQPTVAKLIFRTYDQHQGDEWAKPCLDVIDQLCLEGIGEAQKEMAEFER